MKFGPCPLDAAEGSILAHSVRVADRMLLKKGTVLDRAMIDALRTSGLTDVVVARLDADDIGENDAAERIARALVAPHITPSQTATGRVNLLADAAGLLLVDADAVHRLNMQDQAITLATLPDASVVAPREMVATIKIIPFSVPSPVLDAALCKAAPVFSLHPFRPLKVGLTLSTLPGLKDSVLEGTIVATQARITALGGTLLPVQQVPHTEAAIAAALHQHMQQGAELLLVAGASAVVDRTDTAPAAIVQAGGEILHVGMPVDPGNLICLGQIGTCPALVLPGCARSPKLNGIDFVLRRIFAGLPVTGADIMRMGVGGLLKDIDARPMPRAQIHSAPPPRHQPVFDALVLAAGRSQRMAPHNKLLLTDDAGTTLIARTVDQVLTSRARRVHVVVGHQEAAVRAALAGRDVTFVQAPDYADGLSASLRAGIAALPPDSDAALVCLGDMPLVSTAEIDRLFDHFAPDEGRAIILPTRHGKRGNPVLWARRFYPQITAVTGDVGARHLIAEHAESVVEVEMETDAVLRDFDTPDSLPWPVQIPEP